MRTMVHLNVVISCFIININIFAKTFVMLVRTHKRNAKVRDDERCKFELMRWVL